MLKILTVCGAGVGSSIMLKVFAEQILRSAQKEADIQSIDIGSVGAFDVDIIITTPDLAKLLRNKRGIVIELINLTDRATLQRQLLEVVAQIEKQD